MKLQVERYNAERNHHECRDESGWLHRVDLFVNGDLPENVTEESLVGQTVEVERLHPYEEIAHDVRLIDAGTHPHQS